MAAPALQTVSTVRLTRSGTIIQDIFPVFQILSAIRRSNSVDKIIVINDVQYDFSTAQFLVDMPVALP